MLLRTICSLEHCLTTCSASCLSLLAMWLFSLYFLAIAPTLPESSSTCFPIAPMAFFIFMVRLLCATEGRMRVKRDSFRCCRLNELWAFYK